jgi:Flp pilus assembly pilin Flp
MILLYEEVAPAEPKFTSVTTGPLTTVMATNELLCYRRTCRNLVKIRQENMPHSLKRLWAQDDGQDVAEYSVMLAVVLIIALGAIRMIGSSANVVFSSVGSAIQ